MTVLRTDRRRGPLATMWRVMFAVILRDIRTRFFGHGLGYLIAIAWPLGHIVILLIIRTALGRSVPYGESAVLFFATGLVPFFTWSYMSRFIMMSMVMNRPLLALPVVKPMDILLGRAVLEVLAAICVVIAVIALLWSLDVDFVPRDIVQAACALGACSLLGLGFGIANGVIASLLPLWTTGYALVIIGLYIGSGIVFIPDTLPTRARDALAWNPILQGVEWMRSAYYDGLGEGILDKTYMLSCAFGAIFIGLVLERALRGRILNG